MQMMTTLDPFPLIFYHMDMNVRERAWHINVHPHAVLLRSLCLSKVCNDECVKRGSLQEQANTA